MLCAWGVSALGVGSAPGGGVSAPRGVPGQALPPVDRQTPVNILPCPKLRLRAVKIRVEHTTAKKLYTLETFIAYDNSTEFKSPCTFNFRT